MVFHSFGATVKVSSEKRTQSRKVSPSLSRRSGALLSVGLELHEIDLESLSSRSLVLDTEGGLDGFPWFRDEIDRERGGGEAEISFLGLYREGEEKRKKSYEEDNPAPIGCF
jgi:hypothetical protein